MRGRDREQQSRLARLQQMLDVWIAMRQSPPLKFLSPTHHSLSTPAQPVDLQPTLHLPIPKQSPFSIIPLHPCPTHQSCSTPSPQPPFPTRPTTPVSHPLCHLPHPLIPNPPLLFKQVLEAETVRQQEVLGAGTGAMHSGGCCKQAWVISFQGRDTQGSRLRTQTA